MHTYFCSRGFLRTSIVLLLWLVYRWFQDIVVESTYEGHHTLKVQQGLRYGMLLFIVSEVMFFFSFFWAFFHSSLTPAVSIGCVWPPQGIEVLSIGGLPLTNTLILLTSGVTVTLAH
jgi:cytochrome c oxidase subunit 3